MTVAMPKGPAPAKFTFLFAVAVGRRYLTVPASGFGEPVLNGGDSTNFSLETYSEPKTSLQGGRDGP